MYSLALLTLAAFGLSLLLTPWLRDWSIRIGLVDRPDNKRKIHSTATPRTGGVPILISYTGAYALLLLFPIEGRGPILEHLTLIGRLLPPVGLLFLTGLIDDWLTIDPKYKLLGQIAASVWAWQAGVRIAGIAGHSTPSWVGFAVTVAWLVLCSNAFNLIDGVDGLATGVGLTATLTVFIAGLIHGDIALVFATAPLAGCLIGFLRYNFNPASIFLGDSGSLLIGFLLGCYSVIWSQKSATMLGMVAPVMALALPLLEVGLSIVRRFLHGQPIFSADRGHIHHRLLDRGFTPRRVALLLYGVCALGAVLSLFQSLLQNAFAVLAIPVFAAVVAMGIRYLRYAEFAAARRFLWAGLRPMVGGHVKLELLERSLVAAANVDECWHALAQAGRSLGYSQMAVRLGEATYSLTPAYDNGTPFWQMRLNLTSECYVNISHPAAAGEQPVLLIPFIEIVRRVLPEKLRQLDRASPVHAVWRNSRTTTVISSDCAAPSVNAATAS